MYAVNCHRCGRELPVGQHTFEKVLAGHAVLVCLPCLAKDAKSKSAATRDGKSSHPSNPSVR